MSRLISRTTRGALCAAVGMLAAAATLGARDAAGAQGAAPNIVPGRYIVVLRQDVQSPRSAAADLARRHGLGVDHVYTTALKGFSAVIPEARLRQVSSDPRVCYMEPDQIVSVSAPKNGGGGGGGAAPQVVPSGIARIGTLSSPTARIDGLDDAMNVDVAVVDTGIQIDHPDLKVVGGVNFASGNTYNDGNGHGTHVAGTIAARDNAIGVVGVAPGARLWAVRVLGNNGSGYLSWIISGLDWVAARGDIEVANLSLGATGNALNDAVEGTVARGVAVAVAAGNESSDASGYTPASAAAVMTVSALRDTDDSFAYFSNFGAVVELIAPGVSIYSTWKGGGYKSISGTSMASPHVAGAAALYKVTHPAAAPADVTAALLSNGDFPASGSWPGDPDGIGEPLVKVNGL